MSMQNKVCAFPFQERTGGRTGARTGRVGEAVAR